MSNDDPTKWEYFEKMKVPKLLVMADYYNDKVREKNRQLKKSGLL